MTDPLSLLPLAVAAGGGRIDGLEAARVVAAGLTLLQRSPALVRALSGRRAAILLPTSHQFFTALAAAEGRGAVLVNPLAAPAEIAYQLTDANVGAAFTNRALAARLPAGLTTALLDDSPRSATVIAADGTTATVDLGSHFGIRLDGEPGVPGSDDEVAIVYTSAMAGTALGAILSHRNLLANARSTVEAAEIGAGDHALAVLPFAHLFGLTVTGVTPLLVGGEVTTMERFNPVRALETMETAGVTLFVGVPAVFVAMLSAIERRGGRLNADALRVCICGGAELAVEVQDRWFDATGVELRQGYGLTEAAPVCLFNRLSLPNRRGTLGVSLPDVHVEIQDPATGAPVPNGTEGEICVRGDNVFRGYVNGGDQGLPVRGGWLHTGDRGVQGVDHAVAFTGLLKPMFTRSGFNVYPREIERVLREMPGVRAARVRGVPDPVREHEIAVEVDGHVTEPAVKSWCESRLSAYKQPGEITIRP
ncbi:MAG TPA: AMP-binding protein [Gemmatimonadaceae bacterium]|nr:AMP-binding protein [Gemmatimonadaceae bacterium]